MMEAMQVDIGKEEVTSQVPQRDQPLDAASKTGEVSPRGDGREENELPKGLWMLAAFMRLNYDVYGGTVPKAVVLKRRARNKVARISRRVNRRNA